MSLRAVETHSDQPPRREDGDGVNSRISQLVLNVAAAFDREAVRYCQWKGSTSPARWGSGHGDIDLLISRKDTGHFLAVMHELGFRHATAPGTVRIPGVESWLGYDPETARLIHLHAHWRLIIGSASSTHYQLPVDDAVIASARSGFVFRTPSREIEFGLHLLHNTAKMRIRDLVTGAAGVSARLLAPRTDALQGGLTLEEVAYAMHKLLPELDLDTIELCRDALDPDSSWKVQLRARRHLGDRLSPYMRRPDLRSSLRGVAHRTSRVLYTRVPNVTRGTKRLLTGGRMITLAGTDGSGKSTCAAALVQWLGGELLVRPAHFGRPPRGALTRCIGFLLRTACVLHARLPGRITRSAMEHLQLARCLCTARDRLWLYTRARRFVARGGILVSERFPLPEDAFLVGPSTSQGIVPHLDTRLARMMRSAEQRAYLRISKPGIVFRLLVDPMTAVTRKTNEPADYVYARAVSQRGILSTQRNGHDVDAGRPLKTVLADLRERVWKEL